MKKDIVNETLRMAWPAILESFFVALAGLVDSYMVSSLGKEAVASVGLTTQPKFLGLAVFIAINVSVSALVARRKGEQRREAANNLALSAYALAVVLAMILSVFFVAFASPIMEFCGSTEATHDGAVAYYRIIMGGMIFNCISLIVNASQRGAGNTKITMRTNLTANLLNVIFNYLLINGHFGFPALGIRGAALATVLGTVVGSIMSVLSILPKDNYVSIPYMLSEKILPTAAALKNLVRVGYSIFFEQLLMRIGFMATSIMAAAQGTESMAAHQVAMNIMGLSFSFGDGLQAAAVALIGFSLGAKDPDRAKEYGKTCRIIGGCFSVCLALVYFFGAKALFTAFFPGEDAVIRYGIHIMYIIIFTVLFQIAQVIYMGCLRGAGDTLYTACASTVSVTLVRTLASYLFGYMFGMGIEGIWLGVLADQISRFLFASIRFKQGKWIHISI